MSCQSCARAASLFLVAVLLPLLTTAGRASADTLATVWATDYAQSYDAPGGIENIAKEACQGALRGFAVVGMDAPGDWIELQLPHLGSEVSFVDSLRSAGGIGDVREFEVDYLDPTFGDVYASDTLTTTPGLGTG